MGTFKAEKFGALLSLDDIRGFKVFNMVAELGTAVDNSRPTKYSLVDRVKAAKKGTRIVLVRFGDFFVHYEDVRLRAEAFYDREEVG